MLFSELLYTQGFGTRRVCLGLVQNGLAKLVFDDATPVLSDWRSRLATEGELSSAGLEFAAAQDNPDLGGKAGPDDGMPMEVQGTAWEYRRQAVLMLHKPANVECSAKPKQWPGIYTLLPAALRQRPVRGGQDGVQTIGRLDVDTTGLILLSDDGPFIHRVTSPKHHVPKVYRVTCKHPLASDACEQLVAGVVLDDSPKPVAAQACVQISDCVLDLTITEGKYHQVKRMMAAIGNRCESLHRSQIGGLCLPDDLAPGQWRWLRPAQLAQVRG